MTVFSTKTAKLYLLRRFFIISVKLVADLWSRLMMVAMCRFEKVRLFCWFECHFITKIISIALVFEILQCIHRFIKSCILFSLAKQFNLNWSPRMKTSTYSLFHILASYYHQHLLTKSSTKKDID